MKNKTATHHPCVVIGSGIAGFAIAQTLQSLGHEVLCLAASSGATALSWGSIDLPQATQEQQRALHNALRPLLHTLDGLYSVCVPKNKGDDEDTYQLLQLKGGIHRCTIAQSTIATGDLTSLIRQEKASSVGLVRLSHPHLQPMPSAYYQSLAPSLRFVDIPLSCSPSKQESPFALASALEQEESLRQDWIAQCRAAKARYDDVHPDTPLRLLLFPPVLGLSPQSTVTQELREALGIPCAEMLATHPSVPGFRLQAALEKAWETLNIPMQNREVVGFTHEQDRITSLSLFDRQTQEQRNLTTDQVFLATGAWVGGGLSAPSYGNDEAPHESIFHLPIGPPSLSASPHLDSFHDWSRFEPQSLLQERADDTHPLFEVGVAINAQGQPITPTGTLPFSNLYAAGAIVARPPHPLPHSADFEALTSNLLFSRPTQLGQAYLQGRWLAQRFHEYQENKSS